MEKIIETPIVTDNKTNFRHPDIDKHIPSVKDLAKKNGVITVHGISHHSMVIKGERPTLLLNLLVNKHAEVAATVIYPNNPDVDLFVTQGLLLADGTITFAASSDVVSTVDKDGFRKPQEYFNGTDSPREALQKIIEDQRAKFPVKNHNEVFVKDMNYAGYYYKTKFNGDSVDQADSTMITMLHSLNIPLYCLSSDGIKRGIYDESLKRVKATGQIFSAAEIVDNPITLSDDKRDWVIDVLRDDFPYRINADNAIAYLKGLTYLNDQTGEIPRLLKEDASSLSEPDALMLYGYGQAMRKFGWIAQAEQAEMKGQQKVDPEKFQKFQKKFQDEKLKLSREEMKRYLETGSIDWFS